MKRPSLAIDRRLPKFQGILSWCLLMAAVAAQTPDQLTMSPTAPVTGNTPAVVEPFPDFLLLGAAPIRTPFVLPGVNGALQVDPALLQLNPRRGWGPEVVAAAPILPISTEPQLEWQLLGPIQNGIQFSQRRQLGASSSNAPLETEAQVRMRAMDHVATVADSGFAPGWKGSAGPTTATPIYRPDVPGPAYYHFEVDGGGYVVLSTGDHDAPVSHWNPEGSSLIDQLQEVAQPGTTVDRFYRLDVMCWCGEDKLGNLVAQIGNLPPKVGVGTKGWLFESWSSWAELKAGFRDTYRPMIENEAMRSSGMWWVERNGNDGPWSPWAVSWTDGGIDAQCDYNQFQYSGCQVGCGPVAWGMLFGWADRRAAGGDPNWAHRWGLYRENGGYGADATAPDWTAPGVRNMISEIRDRVGTFCVFSAGATAPWDMHRADRYLSSRTGTTLTTHYDSLGIHWGSLHAMARDEVYAGKPSIIGTGWLNHYPVVVGYAERWRDEQVWFWTERQVQRCFYLNMGWGGRGNGWYDTGTWFCGRIFAN